MLKNTDIEELVAFRHALHKNPELSGKEVATAAIILQKIKELGANKIVANLGGHGIAAIFDSGVPGPCVLFRAELDALPIVETSGVPWASNVHGVAHLCGHDGHMTMLLALGKLLSRKKPKKGRVVLMFQPAEEDGSGARAVLADPKFATLAPDWAFAIHNEPGLPFGYVGIKEGVINCASRGLAIRLSGRTSHAAEPELANSPITILPEVLKTLDALGRGGPVGDGFRLSTITHVEVGEKTFGITPGEATIYVTIRASHDEGIAELQMIVEKNINAIALPHNLSVSIESHDDFAASINDGEAVKVACSAMKKIGVSYGENGVPMRASEDFGAFGWHAKAAMLCLGPGESHVALHGPDYDFADDLIPIGAGIFEQITRELLG